MTQSPRPLILFPPVESYKFHDRCEYNFSSHACQRIRILRELFFAYGARGNFTPHAATSFAYRALVDFRGWFLILDFLHTHSQRVAITLLALGRSLNRRISIVSFASRFPRNKVCNQRGTTQRIMTSPRYTFVKFANFRFVFPRVHK